MRDSKFLQPLPYKKFVLMFICKQMVEKFSSLILLQKNIFSSFVIKTLKYFTLKIFLEIFLADKYVVGNLLWKLPTEEQS